MNYITVSVICIIALIIGIFNLTENELFSKRKKEKFIGLALIIILEIVLDTVSFEIDGKVNYLEIYKSIKILEFIIAPMMPMLLASIVSRKTFWKKIKYSFFILLTVNIITQLVTIYEPFIFTISEEAVYTRTLYTKIYICILLISLILLIVSAYNSYMTLATKVNITLVSSYLYMVLGMVIRLYNDKSNADWLCICFGYFIFLLDFSNRYLKIDSLTSLLNRRAFDYRLAKTNYSTALIIIDANNFKSINDTYGHQSGDWTLSKIAEIILEVYGKIAYCYRIGGDEFCIILKPNMLEELTKKTANYDNYKMIKDLMAKLDERINEIAKENGTLKYGVSQGFGLYYSLLEYPSSAVDYKSIKDVYKIADERMYKAKAEFKKRLAEQSKQTAQEV
jgi:diguanylate cyclase (GGDEF)-like protein